MVFKRYKMEDIANFSQGKQVEIDNQYPEKKEKMKRFLRIVDFTNPNEPIRYVEDFGDKYYATKEDLVMIRYGSQTCGKVVIGKEGIIANNMFKINLDNSIVLNRYAYYYLKQNKVYNYLRGSQNSSTMPSINFRILNKLEIEVPIIDNQIKIIKILNDIDEKIVLNNEINNNLYKLCNNIFHEYLDKYESKIEYKKIVDIAKKVVTGKTPSTINKDFWDGDIPFITIPDMHNQVFTIKTERNITELGARSIIPKNSISVSCIATVGLVSINTEDSQTNQQINSIVINNDYDLYFLFEYLSEQEQFMKSIAGGSTTYNINKNTFENMEVPYLPKDLLVEFNNSVSNMFEKIKLNQYENERLTQLRDTLLPKLMNGEIDLDNMEI